MLQLSEFFTDRSRFPPFCRQNREVKYNPKGILWAVLFLFALQLQSRKLDQPYMLPSLGTFTMAHAMLVIANSGTIYFHELKIRLHKRSRNLTTAV